MLSDLKVGTLFRAYVPGAASYIHFKVMDRQADRTKLARYTDDGVRALEPSEWARDDQLSVQEVHDAVQ